MRRHQVREGMESLYFPETAKYEKIIRSKSIEFFKAKARKLRKEAKKANGEEALAIEKERRDIKRMGSLIGRLAGRYELPKPEQRNHLFELSGVREGRQRREKYILTVVEYYKIRLKYDDYSPAEALEHLGDRQYLGWDENQIRQSLLNRRKSR